jgi:hypothetical protein
LDAYLGTIALELFKPVKECKVVVSLVDADVKIVDVFSVFFHWSFVE